MQRSTGDDLPEPQRFDRVLSSMCTRPHPAARAAAERFLATNPGDPATYRAVAALEREVVAGLATATGLDEVVDADVGLDDAAGDPDDVAPGVGDEGAGAAADPDPDPDSDSDAPRHGYVASGGTEANLQAVRAARDLVDVPGTPTVVAPASAHFSFRKAAAVLGVDLRTVPTDDDHRADVDATAAAIDRDTVLVVGVAGTTERGRVDPIPALADLAVDAGARLHVDAAWGGFVLPFDDRPWSFPDARVDTVTIDPHKYGRAVVPAGGLLARDPATMDALAVDTPYLESTSQVTLTGTRSGAGVASAAAAMRALWPGGYRETAARTRADAAWLADALADRGVDVTAPDLPIVAAEVDDATFAALRERGWRLARTADDALRVVCMPHVTRPILRAFLDDLDAAREG